jgi:4Fe-4S ferredoxin
MNRGSTLKHINSKEIMIERKMVTYHDILTWDLERCVGCQICTLTCPKDALIPVHAKIENGRMTQIGHVDVDPEKCVFCGMCVPTCPNNAISLKINGEDKIPVQEYDTYPEIIASIEFDPTKFDWDRKDFVIDNCPTTSIAFDQNEQTLVVDHSTCIHCRQCEVASHGAFSVKQAWEGSVALKKELCVEDCLACADVCPTRALYIDENQQIALADYYCIKCGACMNICPVQPIYQTTDISFESQGMNFIRKREELQNASELPILVERWRINHSPVESAAWLHALMRLADDKAGMVEIDRKRALKRKDLLSALKDANLFMIDDL